MTPEERVANNNTSFREANESIRDKVAREQPEMSTIPFLCECPREDCHELVPMSLETYADVRSKPTYFINALGHESAEGSSALVVERRETFVVVEKVGASRAVAIDDWTEKRRA